MLLISATQLRALVSPAAAIAAVRAAFVDVSANRIEQPTRLVVGGGDGLAMIARSSDDGATILKGVTIRPQNAERGLAPLHALAVLFDGSTGEAVALVDGTSLTALRTGAASAVATDLLAVPDAAVLAMIGAGGQAADQVRSVCAVRPIREVRIAARRPDRAAALVARLTGELPGVRLVAAADTRDAVASADVVCTATTATEPLFAAEDLRPHVHVNAVGAHTPALCELPADLFGRAAIVAVDRLDAALAEAGDLLRALRGGVVTEDALVEIGVLLADPSLVAASAAAAASRTRPTIFKSVGIAAQDLAVARLAYELASTGDPGSSSSRAALD